MYIRVLSSALGLSAGVKICLKILWRGEAESVESFFHFTQERDDESYQKPCYSKCTTAGLV